MFKIDTNCCCTEHLNGESRSQMKWSFEIVRLKQITDYWLEYLGIESVFFFVFWLSEGTKKRTKLNKLGYNKVFEFIWIFSKIDILLQILLITENLFASFCSFCGGSFPNSNFIKKKNFNSKLLLLSFSISLKHVINVLSIQIYNISKCVHE